MITANRASLREQVQDLGPAAVVDAALSGDLARFCGSRLDGARFVGADLREADLSGATGYAIDPRETGVKGARFTAPDVLARPRSLRYRHRVTQTLDVPAHTVSVVIPVYQGAATLPALMDEIAPLVHRATTP